MNMVELYFECKIFFNYARAHAVTACNCSSDYLNCGKYNLINTLFLFIYCYICIAFNF